MRYRTEGLTAPPRRRRIAAIVAAATAATLGISGATSVAAADGYERIINGDFSNGTQGWWNGANTSMQIVDERLCVDVTGGTANPWDALIGQNNIPLEQGEPYTLGFEASAEPGTTVGTTVQLGEDPYTTALSENMSLTSTPQSFEFTFTPGFSTDVGQVTFQLGGHAQDFTFCVDNVSLVGGTQPPGDGETDTGPAVHVNQVGYLLEGPKGATVVTDATSPIPWELHASDGSVATSGMTTVFGDDAASGQHVHTIDFSDVTQPGSGYTLVAAGEASHPFAISADLYDQLRHDALTFYYHQRSGIPIEAQYVGEKYARPAGHVGVSPNQGDISVPCHPDLSCDYTLDVSGGWYDAGDHGKYVVNGGISTWQLLGEYERAVHVEGASASALADGALPLPEAGNGVPDILDEARWELEFLLSMQVPQGEPLAGTAHHKVHDEAWTGIPMPPHQDPEMRYLHSPSTAATLNLAAAAAQCARIYDEYDPEFADRCLSAAERAWQAAREHPNDYAPPSGGNHTGGGAYGDDDVTDEFYWAAAELFITTGQDAYLQGLTSNQHAGTDVFTAGGFSWGYVAPLARLSLATVPNDLPADRLDSVRSSIVTAADGYVADLRSQGYPVPYKTGEYVWGSNSQVLNNAVVIAYAHDLTGEAKYRDAALRTLSYILGRNAVNHSYVSGYGEKAAQNQHHRFWAHQADSGFPHPPDGAMAGGPNSGLQDPVAARELQDCPPVPQTCYIDHIESYSTNEVTINWNAPLAWLSQFAADVSSGDDDGGDQDTQAPSAPEGLTVTGTTQTSVSLDWSTSSDNTGVNGYDVYFGDGTHAGSTSATQATVDGLDPDTRYAFYVTASDAAGNESTASDSVTATTKPAEGGGDPGEGACAIDYRVADQWNTGFTAYVTITNTGDAVDSWTLEFDFTAGQQLTNGWSGHWSQTGSHVTVTNKGWNGSVGTGESTQIGFNGSHTGTNPDPAEFALNGKSCTTS